MNKNVELIGDVRSLLGDDKLSYRDYVENGGTYELATNASYYGHGNTGSVRFTVFDQRASLARHTAERGQ